MRSLLCVSGETVSRAGLVSHGGRSEGIAWCHSPEKRRGTVESCEKGLRDQQLFAGGHPHLLGGPHCGSQRVGRSKPRPGCLVRGSGLPPTSVRTRQPVTYPLSSSLARGHPGGSRKMPQNRAATPARILRRGQSRTMRTVQRALGSRRFLAAFSRTERPPYSGVIRPRFTSAPEWR